jgi:hypothetical protein
MKDLVKQANKIIGMVTFKNIRSSIVSWGKKEKVILMPFIYHR